MTAPWPYDDEDPPPDAAEPSWLCPGGTCDCHPPDAQFEPRRFTILLRDHEGAAMGGARCRVFVNGRLVNGDSPYADGEGRVSFELSRPAATARVEWAPPNTPIDPLYPYRKRYFVDLLPAQPTEAARRRLHNLGFGLFRSLSENVKEFQRAHGYPSVNGLLEEIEDDLQAYHDEGVEPSPPPQPAQDEGTGV